MQKNKRAIGFIAQDFENLPITLGEHFVEKIIGEINKDGPDVELNAMDYDRSGPILWTVCKKTLARIETLETKLNSNELYRYGYYYTNNGEISL